jgi:hypothetical protein
MRLAIAHLSAALALAAAFPQAVPPSSAAARNAALPAPGTATRPVVDRGEATAVVDARTAVKGSAPEAAGRRTVVGIVRLLAADTVEHPPGEDHTFKGHSKDHYQLVLVSDDESFVLKGKKARPNTKVRVSGQVTGKTLTVDTVSEMAVLPAAMSTSGTTRVLVLLAHWNVPDSVTQASARTQMFADSDGFYRDASYNRLGQTGDVTPWMQIAGPAGGQCYADRTNIMNQAKAAALALGYDSSLYANVILYFPNNSWQSGSDCDQYAGWAYVGAPGSWLNGYMDRRVTVHEQGHNYGLRHSHSYLCSNGMTGTCAWSDYGDTFDAMGNSGYVGHFSASQKDLLGWLAGRTADLSAGGDATLAPVASDAAGITAAKVAVSGGRTYWLEYRQAMDFDAWLPSAATDGILVHVTDASISGDSGSHLIDVRPDDGVSTTTATLGSGASWTSPEGVRFTVGTVTAAGAAVSVTVTPRPVCPDAALEPDSVVSASIVTVPATQSRAFCTSGDLDWIKFAAVAGRTYRLETLNLATGTSAPVDTKLTLYAPDGSTQLASNDNTVGLGSRLDFTPTTSGTYALLAEQNDGISDESFTYNLQVTNLDGVAPYVTTRAPLPEATNVSRTVNVTATFNTVVTGVSAKSFTVKNAATGAAVSAAVTRNGTTKQWILNPSASLATDTRYTATLAGGADAIRDAAGNPLATKIWTFTVGPEPYVTTRAPLPSATNINRGANVTATFSEVVTGVDTSTFTVKNATTGAAVSAVVTRNGTTKQWILNPGANLTAKTRYTATLTGGAGAIRDAGGNPLVTKTWSFTTGA